MYVNRQCQVQKLFRNERLAIEWEGWGCNGIPTYCTEIGKPDCDYIFVSQYSIVTNK
jgi:hypothetical protein